MNLEIQDTNHGHPDAVVTTVREVPLLDEDGRIWPTWTVIGTPGGPDLVVDPDGTIHTIGWGGQELTGDHSPEALEVYNYVNQEALT